MFDTSLVTTVDVRTLLYLYAMLLVNQRERKVHQPISWSLAISTIPAAGGPPWASSAHAWNAWHVLVLFVLSSCSTCMHAYVYDVWVFTMSSCHHACISWSLLPSSDHLSARFVRLHFCHRSFPAANVCSSHLHRPGPPPVSGQLTPHTSVYARPAS